jgi:hypothetical protein
VLAMVGLAPVPPMYVYLLNKRHNQLNQTRSYVRDWRWRDIRALYTFTEPYIAPKRAGR